MLLTASLRCHIVVQKQVVVCLQRDKSAFNNEETRLQSDVAGKQCIIAALQYAGVCLQRDGVSQQDLEATLHKHETRLQRDVARKQRVIAAQQRTIFLMIHGTHEQHNKSPRHCDR